MINKPLLIDLDGILRIGSELAPGLQEFFDFIEKNNVEACIISNTSLSHAEYISKWFEERNITCPIPVMTAADATKLYVQSKYTRCAVYGSSMVKELFGGMLNYDNPEVVVVGDMGKDWSYDILNEIFRYVLDGAGFLAMQKNKYWRAPGDDKLVLDAGSFIKAVEHATGTEAELVGKPAAVYFHSGLEKLGYPKNTKFVMIGDDLETDIKGANDLGSESVLVFTGKTDYPLPDDVPSEPAYQAKDLYEVVKLLERM